MRQLLMVAGIPSRLLTVTSNLNFFGVLCLFFRSIWRCNLANIVLCREIYKSGGLFGWQTRQQGEVALWASMLLRAMMFGNVTVQEQSKRGGALAPSQDYPVQEPGEMLRRPLELKP